MLNAGDTMLEYKSSLLQCHPDTHDATYMLASVSYFEPDLSEKLVTLNTGRSKSPVSPASQADSIFLYCQACLYHNISGCICF